MILVMVEGPNASEVSKKIVNLLIHDRKVVRYYDHDKAPEVFPPCDVVVITVTK